MQYCQVGNLMYLALFSVISIITDKNSWTKLEECYRVQHFINHLEDKR